MKTAPRKNPLVPLLVAWVAVVVFGSASVAHMLDGQSGSPRSVAPLAGAALAPAKSPGIASAKDAAALPEAGRVRVTPDTKPRCAECGVVESMREIDAAAAGIDRRGGTGTLPAKLAKRYELTLRMGDGSRHIIASAGKGGWKVGERVIAIAPASGSFQ